MFFQQLPILFNQQFFQKLIIWQLFFHQFLSVTACVVFGRSAQVTDRPGPRGQPCSSIQSHHFWLLQPDKPTLGHLHLSYDQPLATRLLSSLQYACDCIAMSITPSQLCLRGIENHIGINKEGEMTKYSPINYHSGSEMLLFSSVSMIY